MKLCDLTQFYSPVSGGVKRYLQEKAAYLQEHTSDTHLLIVPGERDERRVNGRAISYTIASPLISKTSRYRALLRLSAVQEILLKEKPDLIECGDPYQIAWQALKAAELLGVRALAFYHSHFARVMEQLVLERFGLKAANLTAAAARSYTRNLYNRFAQTLVPSPALAELLQSWGVSNATSVDLGVDCHIFKPGDDRAATRSELGIGPGVKLLLYVGRLAPEKNTALLCDAFRELPRGYHLLVVGDGQQRQLIQKLLGENNSASWIPYCGDPARLAAIYRAADLFVHPGVQETFGFVAVESQACATPVVGIRGSYMDRVIHGDQAHWATEENAQALARAIQAAPANCSEELAKWTHERFAWPRVLKQLFAIYHQSA